MKLKTYTCQGTGTRIHTAMPLQRHGAATALSSWRVGGGIIVAALSTPPVWAVPPKRMLAMANILLGSMEEREVTAGTVGPGQSFCLFPTDMNLLVWYDLWGFICTFFTWSNENFFVLLLSLKALFSIVAHNRRRVDQPDRSSFHRVTMNRPSGY